VVHRCMYTSRECDAMIDDDHNLERIEKQVKVIFSRSLRSGLGKMET